MMWRCVRSTTEAHTAAWSCMTHMLQPASQPASHQQSRAIPLLELLCSPAVDVAFELPAAYSKLGCLYVKQLTCTTHAVAAATAASTPRLLLLGVPGGAV